MQSVTKVLSYWLTNKNVDFTFIGRKAFEENKSAERRDKEEDSSERGI